MNRSTPLLAWGLALVMAGIVLYLWSGSPAQAAPLLIAGAAAAAVGGVLGRRPRTRTGAIRLVDQSPPVVLIAVGLAVTPIALVGGWWLVLVGAGLAFVGLAGVARETRASRRDRIGRF